MPRNYARATIALSEFSTTTSTCMSLLSVVKNIGLNQKEARVYLACLKLGSSPVSAIAQDAGVNRVTAYDILEKLIGKGLVHFFTRDRIRYFDATKPQLVYHEFSRKVKEFKKSLPELKRLTGEAPHPSVRYFEGLEGIKAIYADTLTSKTEILNYANSKEIREHWPAYDDEYVAQRVAKKIFLRGISP
ncbi:MAG: helix-turn-helix domain-containing protein, partial [Patescibacteria group bacterium]